MSPKVSLEQWRALIAVVEAGGYARAAARLHKSQSTLTYAVQKLQSLLGVKVFESRGRKAVLTATGQVLYRRAKSLMDEAQGLEHAAGWLAAGWESELKLAVDIAFPTWLLFESFGRFSAEHPQTRIELYETVLGGTVEVLVQRRIDLAICSQVPPGFAGDVLMRLRFIPVARPDHPLHRLGRKLTLQDLRKQRHLVIRDSASQRDPRTWLGAERRLTVSHKATSLHAVCMGLGFAWFPEDAIRGELDRGELKILPLRDRTDRYSDLYLVFADPDYAGPGARRLAEILREQVAGTCGCGGFGTGSEPKAAEATPSGRRNRAKRTRRLGGNRRVTISGLGAPDVRPGSKAESGKGSNRS